LAAARTANIFEPFASKTRPLPSHTVLLGCIEDSINRVKNDNPDASEHLPPTVASFFHFYSTAKSSLADSLQRTLNTQANNTRYNASIVRARRMKKTDGGYALAHSNAITAPYASTWKTVIPVTPALTLSDAQYRIASRLNLKLNPLRDMFELTADCGVCQKKGALEQDPWHYLSCCKQKGANGEISTRHNAVNDSLYAAVLMVGGQAMREPSGLSDHDGKRPDLQSVFNNKHLLSDTVVTHSLAPSLIRWSTVRSCRAAEIKAGEKHKKYDTLAAQHHATFLAMSVETCGGFSQDAIDLVKYIARGSKETLNLWPYNHVVLQVISNVAIAIQRGNAMIVLSNYAASLRKTSAAVLANSER
jgi:hypothetical protein